MGVLFSIDLFTIIYVFVLLLSLGIGVVSLFGRGIGYWGRHDREGYLFPIPQTIGILSFALFVLLLLVGLYFIWKSF